MFGCVTLHCRTVFMKLATVLSDTWFNWITEILSRANFKSNLLQLIGYFTHHIPAQSWTWVGSIHGSGRVTNSSSWACRVGCHKYLINKQFTCKKPIIRRLQLLIITRSCKIAIYYRLGLGRAVWRNGSGSWNDVVWGEKLFGGQAERFGSWCNTKSRA